MSDKKILIINNGYPSKDNPNYTTYIRSIADCVRDTGIEPDLLVIKYQGKISKLKKLCKYLSFWFRCMFMNLSKFDIIYINHLPYCWPILYNFTNRNKQIFVHWHGNDLVGNSFFLKYINKFVCKKVVKYTNLVPSAYFKRKLKDILNVPQREIYITPSGGVDTDIFIPTKRSLREEYFTIGFPGALIKEKGADVLEFLIKNTKDIERFTHKKIRFNIINYGSDAHKYIKLLTDTPYTVNVFDRMTKDQMPNFYNSSDLVVFPSIREGESLGLVVLEALSCNIPVITFDICAFPEFIIPGITGELTHYSGNFEVDCFAFLESVKKVIGKYNSYQPRLLVEEQYSKKSVVDFYRKLIYESE